MYVRSSLLAAVRRSPLRLIKGLADTKIDCQLWNNLPAEAEISAAAETIDSRHRKSIKHILLVHIDTVRPIARIEELKTAFERNRRLRERISDILSYRYAVGDGIGLG